MSKKDWSQQLPNEISKLIFEYIGTRLEDLIAVSATCMKWQRLALRILYDNYYKSITIDFAKPEEIDTFKKTLERFNHIKLAESVRHVTLLYSSLTFSDQIKVHYTMFFNFIRGACPNVTTLQLDDTSAAYFFSRDLSKQWKSLEKIEIASSNQHNSQQFRDQYWSTQKRYRKSLKSVELGCAKSSQLIAEGTDPSSFPSGFNKVTKEDLKQFPCLKKLKLFVQTKKTLKECDDLFFENLESIELAFFCNEERYYEPVNVESAKTCQGLKSLKLDGHFKTESIEYLMRKFEGLENLDINADDEWYKDIHSKIHPQTPFRLNKGLKRKFVEYLFKIKQFNIGHLHVSNHFELLDAMIEKAKERTTEFHLYLAYNKTHQDISNKDKEIIITRITKNKGKNINIGNKDVFNIFINLCHSSLEQTATLMEKYKRILTTVNTSAPEFSSRPNLNSILSTCSIPKAFEIRDSSLSVVDFNDTKKHQLVESLKLEQCKIDIGIFSTLSQYFPNLKTLRLLECEFLDGSTGQINRVDLGCLNDISTLQVVEVYDQKICLDDLDRIERNESIQTLLLKRCGTNLDFFSKLSKWLPKLNSLTVLDHSLHEMPHFSPEPEENNKVIINMTDTLLNSFSFTLSESVEECKYSIPKDCTLRLSLTDKAEQQDDHYYTSNTNYWINHVIPMEKYNFSVTKEAIPRSMLELEVMLRKGPENFLFIRRDDHFQSHCGVVNTDMKRRFSALRSDMSNARQSALVDDTKQNE